MKQLIQFLKQPLKTSSGTHGWLLVIIGGYLGYMGYQMLQNTRNGLSSMSMQLTVILMSVMIAAGVAVAAYGAWMLVSSWKKEQKQIPANEAQESRKIQNKGE